MTNDREKVEDKNSHKKPGQQVEKINKHGR